MGYYKFEWDEQAHQDYGVVYEVFAQFCKDDPHAFPENFQLDEEIIYDHYCCDDGPFDENNEPTDRELLYDELYYVQDAWWEVEEEDD